MPITIDVANAGATADPNSGSSLGRTTTATIASGALVVVVAGGYQGSSTLSSVSGGGLTWTVDVTDNAATSPFLGIASAFAPSGLASGTTITATFNQSVQVRTIGIASILGVDTGDKVGVTRGTTVWNIGTQAWTTGNATIEAGSILIGASWNESISTGSTPGETELHDTSHANGFGQVAAYRIESSAGSYAVTGTWASSSNFLDEIAVEYRAAAAATGVGNPRARRAMVV